MNVQLISTFDREYGGAARAAYRLHQGFRNIGVTSQLLVQSKDIKDNTVVAPLTNLGKAIGKLKPHLDVLPLKAYPNRAESAFSLEWLPDNVPARSAQLDSDIINLHWINLGYLQIESLAKFKKPIVWTIHDMWAFTGGCYYTGGCDLYTQSCGACPQLASQKRQDLSRWVWQRKAKAWKNINLTIVTPSRWLAGCAQKSSLFQDLRIEVIPNGLDIQVYKPFDKKLARQLLNLPLNKKLILFGAVTGTSDKRKGFHLLLAAIQKLNQYTSKEDIELVIFGTSQPSEPPDFGLKTYYLGALSDDIALSLVYSSADVFVAPSVEDNLPNTIVESLACGTPCVGFKIGGIPDIIDHGENGYLAQPAEPEDLAVGIAWVIDNSSSDSSKLHEQAREKVEREFNLETQALRYLSLFTEIKLV